MLVGNSSAASQVKSNNTQRFAENFKRDCTNFPHSVAVFVVLWLCDATVTPT